MSLMDTIRKGFGFFLMSLGVSAPKKKSAPQTQPQSQPKHDTDK